LLGRGLISMASDNEDAPLRQAAFDHVNRLAALKGGIIDSVDLSGGFEFGGERIPLINPQRGIFKPRQIVHLLSIKADRTPVEYQDGVPEKGRSGLV